MSSFFQKLIIKPILGNIFSGFIYINNNKWVRKYFLALVLINILIFFTFFLSTHSIISSFFNWFVDYIGSEEGFYDYLKTVLNFVGVFISIYLSIVIFSSVATTLSSPIYGVITDKVLKNTYGLVSEEKNIIVSSIEIILNTAKYEIKKIILLIIFFTIFFFLNIIPFLGSLFFLILSFFQIVIFSGLDFFEPAFTYEKKRFRERLKIISYNPLKYWGYLFTGGILCTIPFLNIIFLPIYTIGGIVIYFKDRLPVKV